MGSINVEVNENTTCTQRSQHYDAVFEVRACFSHVPYGMCFYASVSVRIYIFGGKRTRTQTIEKEMISTALQRRYASLPLVNTVNADIIGTSESNLRVVWIMCVRRANDDSTFWIHQYDLRV